MKQFANAKLSVVISSIILGITVVATSNGFAQEQIKTSGPQTNVSEKSAPQATPQSLPNQPAASVKNSAATVPGPVSTPPLSQSQASQSDLLAAVRNRVSRLRAAPISVGSDALRDSKAHRDADQIKILHDWQGDSTEAAWPFNITIGKSKK